MSSFLLNAARNQDLIGNEIIDSGPLSGGVYSEDGMMLVYHGTAYHCTYTLFNITPDFFHSFSTHGTYQRTSVKSQKTHEAPKKDVAGSSGGRQPLFFKRGIDAPTGHVDEKIMTQWMELGFLQHAISLISHDNHHNTHIYI